MKDNIIFTTFDEGNTDWNWSIHSYRKNLTINNINIQINESEKYRYIY